MNLAFDCNYSDAQLGSLARAGHVIVCVAKTKEEDIDWVDRALARGAEVFFSHDLDIPNILQRLDSDARVFSYTSDFRDWFKKREKERRRKDQKLGVELISS